MHGILAAALLSAALGFVAPAQVAAQEPGDGQAAYEKLVAEYQQARREYYEKAQERIQKARSSGHPIVSMSMNTGLEKTFLPRFQAGARKFAGSEGAVPFLTWVLRNGRSDEKALSQALDTLLESHIASPHLGDAISALGYLSNALGAERVRSALAAILAGSAHADVKAQVYYTRSRMDLKGDETARKSALADLRKAVDLAPQSSAGQRAAGVLFEREHLQIGKIAPEIEAADLDGTVFKLSDYRGKVVVLDFWGDW